MVKASGVNSTALLDGFTIQYGYAGFEAPFDVGGGIYLSSSSPTLSNLIISDNTAFSGAGMYNENSNPSLTNVTFNNNYAGLKGGGMLNSNSSPLLTRVTFNNNTTDNSTTTDGEGAGVYNLSNSNPTLVNVTFHGNSAGSSGSGGGMYNYQSSPILSKVTFDANTASLGAGMLNSEGSNPALTNVTFSGNSADRQGVGIANLSNSCPTINNVTFSGNIAGLNNGGGMYTSVSSCNPVVKNSIFWGNGTEIVTASGNTTVNDSLVQGGCPVSATCNSNIVTTNPQLGVLASNGGSTQTMALTVGSPAIDKGNNATCATVDQRGVIRPIDGNLNGTVKCDLGAYEYQIHIFLPFARR